MRYWTVILLMGAAVGSAASGATRAEAAAPWERDGQSLFFACEFKQAVHAFEKALAVQPDRPALHFWLGRSYARLAEVSGPVSAPRNAQKARLSLEQAVRMDPRNDEYLLELFDFYVDSPEWFGGGLKRAAALLERISPGESGERLKQLNDSRKEHSGGEWWMRRAVLTTSGFAGRLVPQSRP